MMKKNKLITMKTLIFLFFLFQISFCYAQTKEETIKWITEALDIHFKEARNVDWNAYADALGDNCGILCAVNFDKEYKKKYLLNLESIDECEMKISRGEYMITIPIQGTSVSKTIGNSEEYSFFQDYEIIKHETVADGKRNVDYFYDTGTLIRIKINPELPEKMAKAIKHLSTFCSTKKELF
jgi:hypothetical protein